MARQYGCVSFAGLKTLAIAGGTSQNPNSLSDGDIAEVKVLSGTTAMVYEFLFDADGTDAEDSTTHTVYRPNDYATAGVWRLGKRIAATWANNANGNPNISDTLFNIAADATPETWESVGPTGSGADHIWTALDGVPAGATVVFLRIKSNLTGASGLATSSQAVMSLYARKNGGAEAIGGDNTLFVMDAYGLGAGLKATQACYLVHPIPIDSNRMFEIYIYLSNLEPAAYACNTILVGYQ